MQVKQGVVHNRISFKMFLSSTDRKTSSFIDSRLFNKCILLLGCMTSWTSFSEVIKLQVLKISDLENPRCEFSGYTLSSKAPTKFFRGNHVSLLGHAKTDTIWAKLLLWNHHDFLVPFLQMLLYLDKDERFVLDPSTLKVNKLKILI